MSEQKFFLTDRATTTRRQDDGSSGQGSGESKRLYVGRGSGGSSTRRNHRAYLRFAEDWTNVAKLESAYLILYTDDYGFASEFTLPDSNDVPKGTVRRLTAAFDNGTANDGDWTSGDYTNPGSTSSDAVSFKPSRAAMELVRVNITEIVEDWMPTNISRHDSGKGANAANHGIVIYGTGDTDENWSFLSDKWSDATYRPRIEINYTMGKTTPSAPTNLTPSGAVASIGGFQGDFNDVRGEDELRATQVEVYDIQHDISSISTANVVTSNAHGLANGSRIVFQSLTGGAGLSNERTYYVRQKTTNTFKVATSNSDSTIVDVTNDYTDGKWRLLIQESGTKVATQTERLNGRSDVTPWFTPAHNRNIAFRLRQQDNESLWSAWSALSQFSVTNTDPTTGSLTPASPTNTFATLDGVHFRASYADAEGDRFAAFQIQMSAYPEGSVEWDEPEFIVWDTGKYYVGAGVPSVDAAYGGDSLDAGTYYWRVRVWDSKDGVSLWSYQTIVLSDDFVPDPEDAPANGLQLRPRAPWRIVIKDMGANRGPGNVVAILENAQSVGAALMYNSPGEAHFTLKVDHPQISVIEPKQTHYSIQFYTGDGWREKFCGLVWDFDANERDVIFYGLDYLALYDYVMDESYDPAAPDKPHNKGGSKYVSQKIRDIIIHHIDKMKALPNSPVGFITRGTIATMDERVTIFSTMVPSLQFMTGLMDSHRGGADKRTRVQVRPKTGGGYEIVVQDNPGQTRTNLRMRYGEMVQGYRTIAFGSNWATRINAIGRQRDGLKVNYERAKGPLDESVWGRFAKATVVADVEDRLDLRRRAQHMAAASSMLGQQMGLGIRVGALGPRDGYDVTDKFPVSIQHGAVNTDNFGHDGLWVCLGVAWEAGDQGQQQVVLTLRPPEGGSAPSGSLLDSVDISPQAEWQIGWTSPDVVNPTSKYWLDQTTGKVYTRNGFGDPKTISGSH